MKIIRSLWLISILFCWPLWSSANTGINFLGVIIPKELVLDGTKEKVVLQGYSANTVEGDPLYIGAFFSNIIEKNPKMILLKDSAMAMVFYFIQDDVSSPILKKIFVEELLVNSQGWEKDALNKGRLEELQQYLQYNLNSGDKVSFEYASNDELTLKVNDKVVKIWSNSRSLFNAVLRTWIGPYPPTREFKHAILGG